MKGGKTELKQIQLVSSIFLSSIFTSSLFSIQPIYSKYLSIESADECRLKSEKFSSRLESDIFFVERSFSTSVTWRISDDCFDFVPPSSV